MPFSVILSIYYKESPLFLRESLDSLFSQTVCPDEVILVKDGPIGDELAYIIHSGFISGYQNRYGDNLKPPTNVYHRMTA